MIGTTYKHDAISFLNILKGSLTLSEESDFCIFPLPDSLKIVSFSSDLLVCVSTELFCEVNNYQKTEEKYTFPVFELLSRLSKVNLNSDSTVSIEILKTKINVKIKISESMELELSRICEQREIPPIFSFNTTPIESDEKCFKIKKENLLSILETCDSEDIIEFKTGKRPSIEIMNPYSWDTVKYFTQLNGQPYESTAVQLCNLFNFVKYLSKETKMPLKIWCLGAEQPFNCKINGSDYESVIYISPFIHTREFMEKDDLVKETIEYLIDSVQK